MPSFLTVQREYNEAAAGVLSQLDDIFAERLNGVFRGVDVELVVPAGYGYAYERRIKGYIAEVSVMSDDTNFECEFRVRGHDQCGRTFYGSVSEHKLATKLPWDRLTSAPAEEYSVVRHMKEA